MSDNLQPGTLNGPEEESVIKGFPQRRVRHITSIQIRNLTPFPVRDAFASALSQPAERSQFTAHGHLTDDLDVTLSRKRSRRISVNSVSTLRSIKSEESAVEDVGHGTEFRGRRRTTSRASLSGSGSLGQSGASSTGRPYSSSNSAPTIRPANRLRTSSISSSFNSPFTGISFPTSSFSGSSTSTAPISFSTMLPDHSQSGLERVIKSRLVETFLAITVPETSTAHERPSNPAQAAMISQRPSSRSRPSTPPRRDREKASMSPQPVTQPNNTTTRKVSKTSPLNSPDKFLTPRSDSSASLRSYPQTPISSHPKSPSTSILRPNGKVSTSKSSQKSSAPLSHSSVSSDSKSSPSIQSQSIPNYLSPIHRPSTNPSFSIVPRSREFADWTDWSSEKLKIELWGKIRDGRRSDGGVNAKGKEREQHHIDIQSSDGTDWKMLEEWNIDLADLVPLPEDLTENASDLPSNTLLITLSPPGEAFYLPSPHTLHSRSSTPSPGYASDPESEVRKAKQISDESLVPPGSLEVSVDVVTTSRRRHHRGVGIPSKYPRDASKTAGWQDLFKLITLQSCIIDNEGSLSDIVQDIDNALECDRIFGLKREVSERESRIEGLRADNNRVKERSEKSRSGLQARRQRLDQRRENLALARKQLDEELLSDTEREAEVSKQRARLSSLRARFTPTRTTLLSTLSTIFPIDLYSPPDLLYTILDVPLPIPLSATDPAPPLSLPALHNVTEEAVATSLGYVAQVVQLLAAYLGKGLVYPVTCIGSRSLIKDGISAMVGPRMFPLFSKGVDTYRFEYGVFLLNKDIELLMADRDLRALDMRHTLPNLKNLLLTLTDGEGARLNISRSPRSTISLSLESPRADSPVEPNTPKPAICLELPVENSSPPASGSTTPTAESDASKKARPFLGFTPLAGFLRSRYPSAIRSSTTTVKEVSEVPKENGEAHPTSASQKVEEQDGNGEDDEDRKTIRGVVLDRDADTEQPGKNTQNRNGRGDENGSEPGRKEKHGDEVMPSLAHPPLVVDVS